MGSQYAVPIAVGASAAVSPYIRPYYSTRPNSQLKGLMPGLAGAAEYESLSGATFWPNASENLSLQGYAQIVLTVIVLASGLRSAFGKLNVRSAARKEAPRAGPAQEGGSEEGDAKERDEEE